MTRAVAILVVLFPVAALAAPLPKEQVKTTAEKLRGVWTLVKSEDGLEAGVKATVEFGKDGVLTLRVGTGDDTLTVTGKYTAEGEKIHYSLKMEDGEHKETLTIKTLTADELVTLDEKNKKEEFKRVKAEK